VVKIILYKRTIALRTSIDFRKDLRRSEPRGDSVWSGWRKEAVKTGGRIRNITEKRRERSSLRAANESRFTWSDMDEYGIPRVRLCVIWIARFWTAYRLSDCAFVTCSVIYLQFQIQVCFSDHLVVCTHGRFFLSLNFHTCDRERWPATFKVIELSFSYTFAPVKQQRVRRPMAVFI